MKDVLDLLPLFLVICIFVVIGYFIWRRATAPENRGASGPVGIGGWLWLLALCQTLAPLKTLASLLPDDRYADRLLAMPHGSIALYGVTALLIAFGLFQCVVIVQMYRRRRSFPTLFLYQWIAYPGIAIASALLAVGLGIPIDDVLAPEQVKESVGDTIGWGVWTLYVFRSVRVRNTFVN
jgi:hypothetical protein